MKKAFVVVVWCVILAFSSNLALASFLEDSLKNGIGVRPLGMGGAFTAVADDVNSIYYNPAGLGDLVFGYSLANHDLHENFYSMNSYNMGNVGPFGMSQFRAESVSGESVDMTTVAMGNFGLRGLSWGVSVKKILWNTKDSSSWAASGDVGMLVRLTPDLTLGLVGQDILKQSELDMPSTGRFGIAWRPLAKALTFAFDAETGRSGDVGVLTHYGAETVLTDGFKLRCGSNRGRGTAGATFSFKAFDVDYAYLSSNDPNGYVHTLSLGFSVVPERKRPFSLVRPREFALIDVNGQLIGGRDEFSILGGLRTGSDNILTRIRRARKDSSIDGIILRISGFEGGIGSIGIVQEIRSELKQFKASGKKVIVYIESGAMGDEYYLASVGDKIVSPYGASIGGLGRSLAVTRLGKLSDKVGVEWQVMAKGKYKNTFDQFSPALTKDQKDMLSGIVSDMYKQMITDIAKDRGIEIAKMKKIADGSIFTATGAKDLKLIDRIGYFKDALDSAKESAGGDQDIRLVDPDDLVADKDDYLMFLPYKVAVVEVNGTIVTGRSGSNILFGGSYVGADTVSEQIRRASDDFMVKAIILRINSPGGSSVGSGQIYQEILKAKEKGKIVIASMGDVCASGGYFIAAATDKIVADPGSITGSIGVLISDLPVFTKLYKNIGVEVEVIKEGKHSDMFSGLRKLTTEEKASINDLLEETYSEFKGVVAKGRGMTTEEVESIAQGRIYTGAQALDIKLVDKLGGFADAVDFARDLGKIPGEPELIYYREDNFAMGNLLEMSEKLGMKNGLFSWFGRKTSEFQLNY